MRYQPRRSSQRWLEGAPKEVLAIYDRPQFADRYTILFGGWMWSPDMGRTVVYLSAGRDVGGSGDCSASFRQGKKIRWCDLPDNIKKQVIEFATPEPGHYVKTRTEFRSFETMFAARMYAAGHKGEYLFYE